MLVVIIMLALLLMGSEGRAEEYHATGSVCIPVTEPAREPACAIWYAPGRVWARTIVPRGYAVGKPAHTGAAVTAEAAPK